MIVKMQSKILILVLSYLLLVKCEHLILGDPDSNRLIYNTTAKYHFIPFSKRIKSEFFSSLDQSVINRILVYDNLNSKAEATVTAGGLNYTYVNILLKSERGNGLDYDIGLYT